MIDFITFASPGQLLRIPPSCVVYIRREDNYSVIYQIDGETRLLVRDIDAIEMQLAVELRHHASGHTFVRLGSQLLVNTRYVYQIDVNNARLILSDAASFKYEVPASAAALEKLINLLYHG